MQTHTKPSRRSRPRPQPPSRARAALRIALGHGLALLALAGPACVSAPRTVAPVAPVVSTLRGEHFRVAVHFPAEGLAQQVLDVAEHTWHVAATLYGDATLAVDAPLTLHLYRDAADYAAADLVLTGGRFPRNQAFAHYGTRSAHVALQPPLQPALLREIGLPKQTARLIAHEAAHLVRAQRLPNRAAHPKWFVDGIASWIDFQVLLATGRASSRADDPAAGTAWERVRALLDAGRAPSVAEILVGGDNELPFYTRYALRQQFVRMLIERHPEAFARFVAALGRLGPGARSDRDATAAFRQAFAAQLTQLDADLAAHVRAESPRWYEHGSSLETAGETWLQIAFPSTDATAWRTDPLPQAGFRLAGHATLLPGESAQFHLRFGAPHDFWQLAFAAEQGLHWFRFDDGWVLLATVERRDLRVGEECAFEVSYDPARSELSVTLEGETRFRAALTLPETARWALGVRAGSAVAWRDLAVELAPARR